MTKPIPLLKTLPNGETYLFFTEDHDPADARRRFLARFGYRADTTLHINDQLWLGPVEPKSLEEDLA